MALNQALKEQLVTAAVTAVSNAAGRQDNDLSQTAVSNAAPVIRQEVERKVRNDPQLAHLTSSEPWWQSRANWAAVITGLTPILLWMLGLFGVEGFEIKPETLLVLSAALATVSNWIASYMARRARTASTPLFSGRG